MSKINTNFLREERAKLGLTQKEMAEAIGKSVSAYCKREVGIIDCTAREIKIIKKTLQLSPSRIDEIFFID